jgi:hypothetical protein
VRTFGYGWAHDAAARRVIAVKKNRGTVRELVEATTALADTFDAWWIKTRKERTEEDYYHRDFIVTCLRRLDEAVTIDGFSLDDPVEYAEERSNAA